MPHASTSNPNQLEHTESSVAQNDVEAASPLPNFQYNPLATPFTCSAAYHVCAAVSCDDTSASNNLLYLTDQSYGQLCSS